MGNYVSSLRRAASLYNHLSNNNLSSVATPPKVSLSEVYWASKFFYLLTINKGVIDRLSSP